jgi:hypothetical protein
VSSITIVSDDATIWRFTYDRHYDDRNSFIIQATDVKTIGVSTQLTVKAPNFNQISTILHLNCNNVHQQ